MNNVVFAGGIVLALAATGWAYRSLQTPPAQRSYEELFVEADLREPNRFGTHLEQATLACGSWDINGSDSELIRTKAVQMTSKVIAKIVLGRVQKSHGEDVGKADIMAWVKDQFYESMKAMDEEPGMEVFRQTTTMLGDPTAMKCVITKSVDSFYDS